MSKVYVAMMNEGWVHRELLKMVLTMGNDPCGHQLEFGFHQGRPIESVRNQHIKTFLESDADYLLFVDDDNPCTRNPLEVVDLDKDILAYPTPIYFGDAYSWSQGAPNVYWNCCTWLPEQEAWTEHLDKTGLQEVDAAGTGMMLIARRVLEHFRSKKKPPFERTFDDWGVCEKGSDYLFCQRAKEFGWKVWAHYDYQCQHFKEQDTRTIHLHQEARDIKHANRVENPNTPSYWDEQWAKRQERPLPFYDKIAEICAGHRVLDFGCGRGDLLARLASAGCQVHGMDISEKAVEICRSRGLSAEIGSEPTGRWDAIVCTEVLEHLDDDRGMLETFFKHTDTVIYSVPHNCLPPGVEPEHRRVYTRGYVHEITPHLQDVEKIGHYLLVIAEREVPHGPIQRSFQELQACSPRERNGSGPRREHNQGDARQTELHTAV